MIQPTRLLLPLLTVLSAAGSGGAIAGLKLDEINWRSAKAITTESLGTSVGRVWVRTLEQLRVPGKSEHVQLIWFKMKSRTDPDSYIASLNLANGTVKTHAPLTGLEVWRTAWAGGKLFLGTQSPGHLGQYDPVTDVLTDLGRPFDKSDSIYSLAGLPDGTLAIGSAGTSEVTLYDSNTRRFRKYGEVGRQGAGYLYYIFQDSKFIYGVPRGACPWDLIAIDKANGNRKTLLTKPAQGYIDLQGMNVTATNHHGNPNVPGERYIVRDGQLIPREAPVAQKAETLSETAFEVLLDQKQSASTGKVHVLYRPNKSKAPWSSLSLTVGIQALPVTRITSIGPSLIAGTTGPYGPMFIYDIARNSTRALGYPAGMNAYSITGIGGKAFVSGYPSTQFAIADISRSFTHNEDSRDGPGIPFEDSRSNPRLIASLGHVLQGSHTGIGIFPGFDGRIYIVGQRHRHYRGFGVAYYDPKTETCGEVDSGNLAQQLQVSWVTPIENGKKLAISTRVQPDENKGAPPPREARVLLVDTSTGKFMQPITPLPGAQALGPISEAAGFLIGTASEPKNEEGGPSKVYKVDLRTGQTLLTRTYSGLICGVSANNDAPQKSHDFLTGPDGKVWTMFRIPFADAHDLLMRIRPSDLGVELLGTIPGDTRFLFMGNDLYLTGSTFLRRIRNATSLR